MAGGNGLVGLVIRPVEELFSRKEMGRHIVDYQKRILELLDQNTELEAQLDAVKPYIRHKPDCNKMAVERTYDALCDCGLEAALEQSGRKE